MSQGDSNGLSAAAFKSIALKDRINRSSKKRTNDLTIIHEYFYQKNGKRYQKITAAQIKNYHKQIVVLAKKLNTLVAQGKRLSYPRVPALELMNSIAQELAVVDKQKLTSKLMNLSTQSQSSLKASLNFFEYEESENDTDLSYAAEAVNKYFSQKFKEMKLPPLEDKNQQQLINSIVNIRKKDRQKN